MHFLCFNYSESGNTGNIFFPTRTCVTWASSFSSLNPPSLFQAKPSKYLWVGGISSSVSEERLEEEFLKFGKIEDFKFLRDRKIAYVEYLKLEDAFEAMKNMNGKKIGGDQIRVDFLRSQSTRRVSWYLLDVYIHMFVLRAIFTDRASII